MSAPACRMESTCINWVCDGLKALQPRELLHRHHPVLAEEPEVPLCSAGGGETRSSTFKKFPFLRVAVGHHVKALPLRQAVPAELLLYLSEFDGRFWSCRLRRRVANLVGKHARQIPHRHGTRPGNLQTGARTATM